MLFKNLWLNKSSRVSPDNWARIFIKFYSILYNMYIIHLYSLGGFQGSWPFSITRGLPSTLLEPNVLFLWERGRECEVVGCARWRYNGVERGRVFEAIGRTGGWEWGCRQNWGGERVKYYFFNSISRAKQGGIISLFLFVNLLMLNNFILNIPIHLKSVK